MGVEREIKLEASPTFRLPDVKGVIAGIRTRGLPSLRQWAVYMDTADLRLARNGITLRHRVETERGKRQEGWTLKLPGAAGGMALVRQEVSWPGPGGDVPPEAVALVRAITRGAPLLPIATVETERSRVQLRDRAGRAVAEIDDDQVVVDDGKDRRTGFREIEMEMAEGAPSRLLDAVDARLLEAGATRGSSHPKVFRALGPRALLPADVVVPKVDRKSRLVEVVSASLAVSVTTLAGHDPGIRLGDDIEDIHKARVATRQLRSDLRTFWPVLDRDWVNRIREELGWLAAALAEVRDADVLLEELRKQVASLPERDATAADRLLAELSVDRQRANQRLVTILDSDRYLGLLNDLTDAASNPPLDRSAAEPDAAARLILPRLVRKPWKALRKSVREKETDPSDEGLHNVRKRAKAVRYAAEAAAPVIGKPARRLAQAMENVQAVLGDLHDAVVAEAWLRRSGINGEPPLALMAGQLIERERQRQSISRGAWPAAWRKAADKRLRAWIKNRT